MSDRLPARFGRYDLLLRLSTGRMAEVFVGSVPGAAGVEKTVAIKRILKELCDDDEFVRAFIQEAKISTSLTHPNVGQVYEFGEVDGQYYLAMEYVRGRDLKSMLDHFRRIGEVMPLPVAIRIVLEVCKALDYAHNRLDLNGKPLELVHRDVSPPNVLISFEGAVKLIDFGVAKALASHRETATGPLRARCAYLSPEQAIGQPIDRRSDLFALGSVFFEMVTGRPVFLEDSDMATLAKLRRAEVPRPSAINPKVPAALEAVILKLLARQPERRYERADVVHDVLERVAGDALLSMSTLQLARWMTGTFSFEPTGRPQDAVSPVGTDELTNADELTVPPEPSATLAPTSSEAVESNFSRSLASAAAFAAGRPALAEKPVDLDSLDFGRPRPPMTEEKSDPSVPVSAPAARRRQLDPMDMTEPPLDPTGMLDEMYQEFTVEELEDEPDEEPTARMDPLEGPGWDNLTTTPAERFPREVTRTLVSRSSGEAPPPGKTQPLPAAELQKTLPPLAPLVPKPPAPEPQVGEMEFEVGPLDEERAEGPELPYARTQELQQVSSAELDLREQPDPHDTLIDDLPIRKPR
jgi:eukaryotic-like serine/threonine-protein kinase